MAAAFAGPAGRRAPTRRYERRLRRTVVRLAGCLQVLRPFDRRVLVLRAGPGRRPSLSRRAAARRLDVTPGRIRRSELRGLRRLRATARSGACVARDGMPVAGAASSGPFEPIAGATLFESGAPRGSGASPARDRSDSRGDVLGTRGSSPPVPRAAQLSPLGPLPDAEGDGPALGILVALLAATLALGVLALRLGGRRKAPAGPPADAAEQDPREWEPPPPPWSRD